MMTKIIGYSLALLLSAAGLNAQVQQGRENINKLCGCFNVEFKYAETFAPDGDYKYHNREFLDGLELAIPVETTDKKIVIQHLLVVGDSMIVKHWREDWEFESPIVWKYEGNKKWIKQELKPEEYKNKWTQTVWEVDDGPRYQGVGEWVTIDKKTFWQNTTDAPLPRREYTVRSDYNILRRGNRLVLTQNGWMHEQDNDKVLVKDGGETLIAQEKGFNIYRKADDKECAYAKVWWSEHSEFWSRIRAEWQTILRTGNTISLQNKVDNKFLYEHLQTLSDQFDRKELVADAAGVKVKATIEKFVQSPANVAGKK